MPAMSTAMEGVYASTAARKYACILVCCHTLQVTGDLESGCEAPVLNFGLLSAEQEKAWQCLDNCCCYS